MVGIFFLGAGRYGGKGKNVGIAEIGRIEKAGL